MSRHLVTAPLWALISGMLLLACGGVSGTEMEEPTDTLGTQESAVCSGSSVSTLNVTGVSSYQGELAGSGTWTVLYPANAVRLEYYVDGVLRASDERVGASGTWYFSATGLDCGSLHDLTVRAYPMVIDSAGSRSTCWDSPRSASQPFIERCSIISAGGYHTLAHKKDGTAWGWGYNYYGQLADGTTASRYTPVQMGISNVTAVSGHGYQTAAVKQDGTVWTWGNNDYSLYGGYGPNSRRTTPVQMGGIDNVRTVAAGSASVVALKHDGTVWAWGGNSAGQLGDGTTTDRATPVQVVGLNGVVAIAAGYQYTVALKQDGTVWAWGNDGYGQLGNGTTTYRTTPAQVVGLGNVVSIAAGKYHTVALRQDGTAWTWGYNADGRLGNGTTTNRATPGQVVSLGNNVVAITAGGDHTVALKKDGTVWTWGDNFNAQLGDGTTTDRTTPVQVVGLGNVSNITAGHCHTVARKRDGTVWDWGYNSSGQLGDGTSTQRSTPVQVMGFSL